MYAQNNSDDNILRVAVIPLEKAEGVDSSYEYLGGFIQNSLIAGLKNIEDISIISVSKVNEVSEELNLNRSNLDLFSLTMRFGYETGANLILSGRYDISPTTEEISLNIVLYSIPQKKIISEYSATNDVNTAVFKVVDEMSLETLSEAIEQKEEIELIEGEELFYVYEPKIISIDYNEIIIEWETNKETISTLFVSDKKNFDIDRAISFYYDNSEDAISHKAYTPLADLIRLDYICFKSADYDTARNTIKSREKRYTKEDFGEIVYDSYKKQKDLLYDEFYVLVEEEKYYDALSKAEAIYKAVNGYNNHIDIASDLKKAEKLINDSEKSVEAWQIIKKGLQQLDDKLYEDAIETFKDVKQFVIISEITELIPLKRCDDFIRIAEYSYKVAGLIDEADRLLSLKEYGHALDIYKKAIAIIKEQSIDDVIPVSFIQGKIDHMNSLLSFVYMSAGIGGGKGFGTFNDHIYNTILPSWSLGLTFRVDEFISWGLDINLFYGGAFIKLSPINDFWNIAYSHELYFKGSAIFGYTTNTGYTPGITLSAGYIQGFRTFRLYAEFTSYFMYSALYNEDNENPLLFFIDLIFGIVIDF
jgi:hypothetical protein